MAPKSMFLLAALAVLLSGFQSGLVIAHMEMSQPLPPRSQYDPTVPEELKDYNLKSPLDANGDNFPCHGYQNDRPIVTKATYNAGGKYTMTIAGTVNHGGGSCQLSLSYDNGATFKVIKSMIGNCPLVTSWDFTIPTFAPAGTAMLAWTWFNEIGNREMYMNCAWVQIQGSASSRIKKRVPQYNSMDSLPYIWRANIAGLSTCNTTEGIDPHFANLGPDVVYGPGKSATDQVTEPDGNCDNPTPYGQTYKDLGNISASGAVTAAAPTATTTSAGVFAEGANSASTSPSASGGVFAEGPATISSNSSMTRATTTATMTTTSSTFSSAVISPTATPPTSNIPFASNNTLNNYLPCVPGSFLCLSSTSFMICDQSTKGLPFNPSMQWVGAPQQVASGMQCVPYLAPLPSGSHSSAMTNATQPVAVPSGFFRSDRYIIAS